MAKKAIAPVLSRLPKDPYRVLAFDLSLTSTGWAHKTLYGTRDGEVRHGIIVTGAKGPERLEFVRKVTENLLLTGHPEDGILDENGEYRTSCDFFRGPSHTLVLLENYAFGKSNQAHQMGELGGVIRHLLWSKGYSYYVVTPTRLKKFLTGKGVADKNIILKEVFKRWKFDVDDDNVADALVLMQLGLALVGKLENTTAFQEAVVQEVLKDLSKVEE